MRFSAPTTPTATHCAGSILIWPREGSPRIASLAEAESRFWHVLTLAADAKTRADNDARRWCAALAIDLHRAICGFGDWRRACGGIDPTAEFRGAVGRLDAALERRVA